jgi:hypothetical protein
MDMTLIVEDTGAVLEFERLLLHSKWQEEKRKWSTQKVVHTKRSPHKKKPTQQQTQATTGMS